LIQAVQVYQSATGVSLAEAREAVEEMAQIELAKPPSDVRSFDNPVLEARIKSLLARGNKIDAIKIFREEYGVGLNEAKAVVDRMEASMQMSPSSMSRPYEPAIGSDPFAEDTSAKGQRVILTVIALGIGICGAAVFLLFMNL
jgi:ribosomal protein L7/L12